jgi:hypothetical protein
MIIMGIASRSSTIDAALKPLIKEARRRRSVYKSSNSAGLYAEKSPALVHDLPKSKIVKPGRRPNTPSLRHRRQASLAIPNFRSFSTSDQPIQPGLLSPRHGLSLPLRPTSGGIPRRLAKSAHLHTIEADRVRQQIRAEPTEMPTPKPDISPAESNMSAVLSEALAFGSSGDEHEGWDTDGDGRTGSVDHVEVEIQEHSQVVDELIAIWDEKS